MIYIFIAMFIFFFCGMPIAFGILSSTIYYLLISGQTRELLSFSARVISASDSYVLLAVPFFSSLMHASDPELSPPERYWRLMNEGRDVTAFEPIGREATRPVNRALKDPEFNRRRMAILDEMAATDPRPAVRECGSSTRRG